MIDSAALRDHLRRRGAARLERRAEMCVEQVVELCAGDVEDRLAGQPRGARAVHQDVDPAEFLYARCRSARRRRPGPRVSRGARPRRRCVRAASAAASASRPLTTTPAPCAASSSATARPMPRVPPTTTAPRPASGSLIALALLNGLHHVHVPVAAQVGEQAGVVDLVGEDAAHRAGRAVRRM